MHLRFRIALALIGILLMTGTAICAADSVTFRFSPPVGKEFWQIMDRTQTTTSLQGKREIVVHLVERDLFSRDEAGLKLSMHVDSIAMFRDSTPITDPLAILLTAGDNDARIGDDGGLQSAAIPAIDSMLDVIGKLVDGNTLRMIASMLSPEAVFKKVKDEWGFYVEQFVGKTMAVGDTLSSTSDFEMENGAVMHFSTMIVLDSLAPCQAGSSALCACLHYRSMAGDSGSLGHFFDDLIRAVSDSTIKAPEFSQTSQMTTGEMRLDPQTLLCYGDKQTREITLTHYGQMTTKTVTRTAKTMRLVWSKP